MDRNGSVPAGVGSVRVMKRGGVILPTARWKSWMLMPVAAHALLMMTAPFLPVVQEYLAGRPSPAGFHVPLD